MADDEPPPSEDPVVRCPRCGGKPAPPRRPTKMNPFLPKVRHFTCVDCGLDYGADGRPVRP